MPNSPFTRLVILNIFWRSPCQVLRIAHHSSGDTSPTYSSLDHFAVSLSKQTDIVRAEGHQLDSCDIVRYTDQCCIGLKSQSESFTIRDLLMLPRIELITKGLQKLRFAMIQFCCISESVIALEPRVRIWYRLPHVNKMKNACCVLAFRKYILSAAIVLGSNIARALPTFAWNCKGEDFQLLNSAQHDYFLHVSSLSLKIDAVNSMKLLYQLKWG